MSIGDMVKVVPVEQMDKNPDKDPKEEEHFNRRHFQFMEKFLGGSGPYKIKRIGQWPCGRFMLYLDLPEGREPGSHATDFVRA